MTKEHLIVVFTDPNCSSCKSLIPYLYKVDNKWVIVVVDAEKCVEDMKYFPSSMPTFYPAILHYSQGKYKGILTMDDIKKIELYV